MIMEITPASESVTAVLTSHLESGENFDGAIMFGFYRGNREEVFIRTQGITVNVQMGDVDDLCRQLKCAKKMALEQPEDTHA